MKLSEILFTLTFGLIAGVIIYVIATVLLAEALFGLGFDIVSNMLSAI